jgi:hypothetical protein
VLIRRRTSRAIWYRRHVACARYRADFALWRADGRRLQPNRVGDEREAEYWLNLCYYWRERLREYLQGVDW